jgi:hypothetical protein
VVGAVEDGELEAAGVLFCSVSISIGVVLVVAWPILTLRLRWSWQFLLFSVGLMPGPM